MSAPETLCPKCGFTPIAEGAEKCPKCGEVFAFHPLYKKAQRQMLSKRDYLDLEATLRGALTGAVSANPGPPAAVIALGGVVWLVRAAGLGVDLREPAWLFGLAAAEVAAAAVLMANIGPAKLFAQLVAVAHVIIALGMANPFSAHSLLTAAIGVVLVAMTVGEPSTARRSVGLLAGVGAGGGALAALLWVTEPPPPGPVTIEDFRLGYTLQVPHGWKRLARDELGPHLGLPSDDGAHHFVGFGSRLHRGFGILALSSDEKDQLLGGCQEFLRRIGGINEATPLGESAPAALGKESLVFELRTASGAVGRLGCGKLGSRQISFAVVAVDLTPTVGRALYERLGAGLTIR